MWLNQILLEVMDLYTLAASLERSCPRRGLGEVWRARLRGFLLQKAKPRGDSRGFADLNGRKEDSGTRDTEKDQYSVCDHCGLADLPLWAENNKA